MKGCNICVLNTNFLSVCSLFELVLAINYLSSFFEEIFLERYTLVQSRLNQHSLANSSIARPYLINGMLQGQNPFFSWAVYGKRHIRVVQTGIALQEYNHNIATRIKFISLPKTITRAGIPS